MQHNEQFPRGLITPVNKLSKGYSVNTLFKNYLGQLNTPYYDVCCPDTSAWVPVRSDSIGSILQYFNPSSETWEEFIIDTGAINTIYSADDSLISNRVVDLAGFNLEFSATGGTLFGVYDSGEISIFTNGGRIIQASDGDDLVLLEYDSTNKVIINSTGTTIMGNFALSDYGGGTITGTPTQILAVDVNGNVIETSLAGVTADNGLTVTGSNIQLGGTLLQNTTLSGGLFQFDIGSSHTSASMQVNNNSANGAAVYGLSLNGPAIAGAATTGFGVSGSSIGAYGGTFTSVNGTALYALSTNNVGIQGQSSAAVAAEFDRIASSTNDIQTVVNIDRQSSGTPTDGIGGAIDFVTQVTSSFATFTSNTLASSWTTAANATRTSKFAISGVDTAVTKTLLEITGAGIFTLVQGLENHVDDAAAAATIPINGLYRNGSIVMIRVS